MAGNNNKSNKAGGDKPEIQPVDITSELIDGLKDVSTEINKIIKDADKQIDQSVSKTLSKIKSISTELGNMSKKMGDNIPVNGNAGIYSKAQGQEYVMEVVKRTADREKAEKEREQKEKSISDALAGVAKAYEKQRKDIESNKAISSALTRSETKRLTNINTTASDYYKLYDILSKKDSVSQDEIEQLTGAWRKMQEAADSQVTASETMATKVVDVIAKGLERVASAIITEFTKGMTGAIQSYNTMYTRMAGTVGGANVRESTNKIFDDAVNSVRKGMNIEGVSTKNYEGSFQKIININEELYPALTKFADMGLRGDTLTAKAFEYNIDSKIMPWLEGYSQERLAAERMMDITSTKQLRSQELVLSKSDSGLRLLQSGVVSQLKDDLYSELIAIDYNTMDTSQLTGDYLSLMEALEKNLGYTPQQAYAEAKKVLDVQFDEFGAMQGSNFERLVGSGLISGKTGSQSYFDAMSSILGTGASSNLEASAIADIFGINIKTAAQQNMFLDMYGTMVTDVANSNKKYTEDAIKSIVGEGEYDKQTAADNLAQFDTSVNEFKKAIDNFGALVGEWLGQTFGGQVAGQGIATVASAIPGAVGAIVAKKGFSKVLSTLATQAAGTGASSAGAAGAGAAGATATEVAGTTAVTGGTVAGGTAAGGTLATVGAVAAPVVGGLVALGMDVHDVASARKKADEWGVSKSSATKSALLFGNQEETSLKNTAKQAGKWAGRGAAIGGTIGAFLPSGPLTALAGAGIGAAIGAVGGAITSVVSGKEMAEKFEASKQKRQEKKAQKEAEKAAEKEAKLNSSSSILVVVESIYDLLYERIPDTGGSIVDTSVVSFGPNLGRYEPSKKSLDNWAKEMKSDELKNVALSNSAVTTAIVIKDGKEKEEKKSKKDKKKKDDSEFENKLLETIVTVGSVIVQAINEDKNGKIDYENGLLPPSSKNAYAVDEKLVNLYPSNLSTGHLV